MSVFRAVGREIGDRVLDSYAAVAARWADFRSTLPLAAGDFRDRLMDLAEGLAAIPGSLRERAALGEWIRFRAQGICEAVLELPAALGRSGSNGLESVRNAVAGAADHEIFDFASQRGRAAVGLGLFASLLAAALVGVGFGGNAGPATAAGPAAVPAAIAAPLQEDRRPVTARRAVRELPASTARRTVAATPAAALRATPVALRAAAVVKSGAPAARPKTRPSSRPKKPRRGPTTSGSAPAGGSGSSSTPSSPPASTAEVVNPSVSPADTAPSAGETSSGASQSSSEPKPKPAPQPPPPPVPVATPPDQPKGTEGDHEGDGNHKGDKGDKGDKGKKSGGAD